MRSAKKKPVSAPEKLAESSRKNSALSLSTLPKFIPAGKLLCKPQPMKWVIEDVIPDCAITGIVGPTESLKTFGICDMLVATATNTPWHGHRVRTGLVIVLAGEGNAGFSRRLKALEKARGVDLSKAAIWISQRGFGLTCAENVRALAKQRIDPICKKVKSQPAMIVIDTVARNFGPGDENSSSDMGAFVDNVDYLKRRYRCAVVLAHHTGHSDKGRARGSSAFKAALDHEILFKRNKTLLTLECTKSKDAAPFDPITFEVRKVRLPWKDDRGRSETSIVLERSEMQLNGGNVPKKQIKALKVLRVLVKEAKQDSKWLEDGHDSISVPIRLWRERMLKLGIVKTDNAFDKLKKKLVTAKKVLLRGRSVALARE